MGGILPDGKGAMEMMNEERGMMNGEQGMRHGEQKETEIAVRTGRGGG